MNKPPAAAREAWSIAIQWARRLLFPDFSNRLTMVVALAGIGLVAVPLEIQVAGANWLIGLLNRTGWFAPALPPVHFQSDPMGYILIFAALAHNVANRYLSLRLSAVEHEISRDRRSSDLRLFDSFLELLPSTGRTVEFLKEHDFSGTFHRSAIAPIQDFVALWDNPEHEFLNPKVEESKRTLLVAATDLVLKVAQHTAPKSHDFFSVYPVHVDPDGAIPAYIRQEIAELNMAASAAYDSHQEFVRAGRQNL